MVDSLVSETPLITALQWLQGDQSLLNFTSRAPTSTAEYCTLYPPDSLFFTPPYPLLLPLFSLYLSFIISTPSSGSPSPLFSFTLSSHFLSSLCFSRHLLPASFFFCLHPSTLSLICLQFSLSFLRTHPTRPSPTTFSYPASPNLPSSVGPD